MTCSYDDGDYDDGDYDGDQRFSGDGRDGDDSKQYSSGGDEMDYDVFDPSLNDLLAVDQLTELKEIDVNEYFCNFDGFDSSPCSTQPAGSTGSNDSSPPLSCFAPTDEHWEFPQTVSNEMIYEPEAVKPCPVYTKPATRTKYVPIVTRPVYTQQIPRTKSYTAAPERRIKILSIIPPIPYMQPMMSANESRKMKNRLSAQASRQRKKDETEAFKKTINDLVKDLQKVREENRELKRRLSNYEAVDEEANHPECNNNNTKKRRVRPKMVVAGTVVMAFGLLTIMTPFYPFLSMYEKPIGDFADSSPPMPRGRVIPVNINRDHYNKAEAKNASNLPDCANAKLNASEALRVNNDINKWVQTHSYGGLHLGLQLEPKLGLYSDEIRDFYENSYLVPPREPSKNTKSRTEKAILRSRERTWRQLDMLKLGSSEKLATDVKDRKKRGQLLKLAGALRQKSDTLYIMPLKDYVLVPTLRKQNGQMPRLSLLLPAAPFNGTHLDEYSFLRVECEVTGTSQVSFPNKMISFFFP